MSNNKKDTNKKLDIETVFHFDEDLMELLNIPKIKLIDEYEEVWKYVKLDRHENLTKKKKFMVSSYGRVYNIKKGKMVNLTDSAKTSTGHYKKVVIVHDGISASYFVHRLVALAFMEPDPERPFVNHIDGIPYHNYLWNLEWVNNSENILHAVKMGLKNDKKGEDRTNALWSDDEIRLICSMMEEGHKATYIYHALGDILKDPKVQYERVRTLYKHIIHQTHWTHISCDYDIDFSKFNYLKESGSVSKKQNENKK